MHLDTCEVFIEGYVKSNFNIIDGEGNSILMYIVESLNIYASKIIMKYVDVT